MMLSGTALAGPTPTRRARHAPKVRPHYPSAMLSPHPYDANAMPPWCYRHAPMMLKRHAPMTVSLGYRGPIALSPWPYHPITVALSPYHRGPTALSPWPYRPITVALSPYHPMHCRANTMPLRLHHHAATALTPCTYDPIIMPPNVLMPCLYGPITLIPTPYDLNTHAPAPKAPTGSRRAGRAGGPSPHTQARAQAPVSPTTQTVCSSRTAVSRPRRYTHPPFGQQ